MGLIMAVLSGIIRAESVVDAGAVPSQAAKRAITAKIKGFFILFGNYREEKKKW